MAPQSKLSTGFFTVWGAEHANEGSRRVETLLPSSVTDNGFAALDINDYHKSAVNIINQIVISTMLKSNLKSSLD